jgi:hypothetical protein
MKKMGTRCLRAFYFAMLSVLLVGRADAAGPLTAEIRPLALRPRTGAPETLDVTLHWTGSGLLEGALELTFPSGDEGTPQYRSHDLALTGGAQNFRLLVPATSQDGGLHVRCWRGL